MISTSEMNTTNRKNIKLGL